MAELADVFLLPLDEAFVSAVDILDDDDDPREVRDLMLAGGGGADDDDDSLVPFSPTLGSSGFGVLDAADDLGSDMGSDYLGLANPSFLTRRGASADQASGREGEGLPRVGFDSGSDSESEIEPIGSDFGDLAPPLPWDCFRIDEDRRTGPEGVFEWEEVEVEVHHYDGREVLSVIVGDGGADDSGSVLGLDWPPPPDIGIAEFEFGTDPNAVFDEETAQTIDWEVLLEADDLGENRHEGEGGVGEDGDLVNSSGYEILVGQFADEIGLARARPPAAKSAVKSLPLVLLTEEDVRSNNTFCAVCKDEISSAEMATRLPCSHHYHGACLGKWLAIRNTCPVCRYELPTDDPEYEDWKAWRDGQSRIRYGLDSSPQV